MHAADARQRPKGAEARSDLFQALAAVGVSPEQADEIVSELEAGAVAGAHTDLEFAWGPPTRLSR
ncbi:hypothetical protein [Streptomyces sp. NPDC059874]|uniref:hypothetical protein n=1 Tax=Streptomyces sp. NPDC059874 TaxID=3346983 RepID=UPI00365E9B55